MEKSSNSYSKQNNDEQQVKKKTEKQKTKDKVIPKSISKMAKGDCKESESTSHTQFFKKDRYEKKLYKVTSDEFFGISESISGSSDTFRCVHGPEGKQYTAKGLLKRNLIKKLDPIQQDPKWNDECAPVYGWEIVKTLEFLVTDATGIQQMERLENHLHDFAKISRSGFKIDLLGSIITIIDNLVNTMHKRPSIRECLILLLKNMEKPILLNLPSDIATYFGTFRNYLGYLGYLLMRLEDDLFDLVSNALHWHLSTPDSLRGGGTAQLRCTLAAAAPVLHETIVRMLAVANQHKFSTFLDLAFLLACHSTDNCLQMMKENIIENVFYRFNPYFPDRQLPDYDINPMDLQDDNVKLGASSVNISTTLSLLLVLVKTTKQILDKSPEYRPLLPYPDYYAQRCFVWAYRYECRAREHRHQRNTLTVIASALLHIFGDKLLIFSCILMPDVLSLSVLTELPPRTDWISTVSFNISQADIQFKKTLIYLCVDCLKVFSYNKFMIQYRHWLLGLLYLLDPGLSQLRVRWSPSLYAELRKTALQALVCTLPTIPASLAQDYGLIRRVMWYIEWYSESPYELAVLYWCVRLLHASIYTRNSPSRTVAVTNLFDTHGVIIIMNLCYTLLFQKSPPVEKSQAIIALCLRLLTSAVEFSRKLVCCVYTHIKWPSSINDLSKKMLDIVLDALNKNYVISDRLLVCLLNLIWEGIVWNDEYRALFIANNGVYKLLDLITMSRPYVQCIALALICDIMRAGDAVGQLVTWRASLGASNAYPNVVNRGSTIAKLLASIFRDECHKTGVRLSDNGVIEDLEFLLMPNEMREELLSPDFKDGKSQGTVICLAAADLAGSRMSKAFAILHMLSEDLSLKVSVADEVYNLYKHIKLAPEDETILVLCSHFLTIKYTQAWMETAIMCRCLGLVPEDDVTLEEFLHIGKGWAKEIKQQQEDVLNADRIKEFDEECSLYAFIGRARLNIALDALREVRCVARSADRNRISHALLYDAVRAHHRRSIMVSKLDAPVLRTYGYALDDQNATGQNVKVFSINRRDKPLPPAKFPSHK